MSAPPPLETVDRAVADLRRGAAVVIMDPRGASLVQSAETLDTGFSAQFGSADVGASALVVTGRRAAVLGLSQPGAQAVILRSQLPLTAAAVAPLVDPEAQGPVPPPGVTATPAGPGTAADAAIRLTKIARLLPAAIVAELATGDVSAWAAAERRTLVNVAEIQSHERIQAEDLRIVSEARVPLADSENCRLVSFRPRDGGAEHLAIVVGTLDPTQPVLTRLHSECFTGDLLGSLRCDCGDQLRGAIQTIAQHGTGVLLYLAQEGRGIGLVNKLRAYRLQDFGFDTLDANKQLGFDDDERVYQPAVQMLRQLGISKVKLLTNNPAKVGALARHGIDVVERVPHVFPSNEHNRSYLATKAKRSGHLF